MALPGAKPIAVNVTRSTAAHMAHYMANATDMGGFETFPGFNGHEVTVYAQGDFAIEVKDFRSTTEFVLSAEMAQDFAERLVAWSLTTV